MLLRASLHICAAIPQRSFGLEKRPLRRKEFLMNYTIATQFILHSNMYQERNSDADSQKGKDLASEYQKGDSHIGVNVNEETKSLVRSPVT